MVLTFYCEIFHSESVILLVLCIYVAKNHFHQFLFIVFKMNDTVNSEDNFFVNFYRLSKHIFPFQVCHTDSVMPGSDIQSIFRNFYSVI